MSQPLEAKLLRCSVISTTTTSEDHRKGQDLSGSGIIPPHGTNLGSIPSQDTPLNCNTSQSPVPGPNPCGETNHGNKQYNSLDMAQGSSSNISQSRGHNISLSTGISPGPVTGISQGPSTTGPKSLGSSVSQGFGSSISHGPRPGDGVFPGTSHVPQGPTNNDRMLQVDRLMQQHGLTERTSDTCTHQRSQGKSRASELHTEM